MRQIVIWILALVLFALAIYATVPLFTDWRLEDFANTFYRVGQNLIRGDNIYSSAYPHPTNGRDYPPYAPIWIWYALVPFAFFPLPMAQAARFWLDVAALTFLAYLSARWARIRDVRLILLLLVAPWLLTELSTGQLTPLVLIGALLCYWGVRRPSASMTAVGLWLALSKFTLVALVILATLSFAWRRKILWRTLAILAGLIGLASIPHPTWLFDLAQLYLDRLSHPRVGDSVLLLPGYPWSQIGLLTLGALWLLIDVWRSGAIQPTKWLWAFLLCASLVGALHTFVYDWQLLMPAFALLIRSRLGIVLSIGLYLYSFAWAVMDVGLQIPMPSPAIIPAIVLIVTAGGFLFPLVSRGINEA